MTFHSALYRGQLAHARTDAHARRAFRYGVYMAAIDLDELPTLDRELHLFSQDRANLFSFRERDYATSLSPAMRAIAGELTAELAALRAANGLPAPHATRLVTNLRAFGYLFNPVSFFIDYDARGEITAAIAEVNNTYGGRLRYVLGPRERVADTRHPTFRHARELFVSPFLHGALTYDFAFDAPLDGKHLAIQMHVRDAAGTQVFAARFAGERSALSDRTLAAAALRYPFMTARVIALIHWQALRLALLGAPYRRPAADHRPSTTA
jgi:uncharacterized protein